MTAHIPAGTGRRDRQGDLVSASSTATNSTSGVRPSRKPGASGPVRRRSLMSRITPYLFVGPAIVLILVLLAFPIVYGGYSSLFRAEIFGGPQSWVGLRNYTDAFRDPEFRHTIWVSAEYTVGCILLSVMLGLVFAFALHRLTGGLRFLRSITIAPYIVSSVAAAVMFRILFNADFGLLNKALEMVGLPGPQWLANPHLAVLVVIICQVWTDLPLTILLILGGLQSIDQSHLDSALVDGASGWRRARHISIPLIAPQIMISVVWVSFQTLTSLGLVLALTGGGPNHATETMALNMYTLAFEDLHIQQAMAVGTFIFLLNAVLTLVYFLVSKRYTVEDV
jgi:ABC-type sugar transport system permease subunit